MATTTTMSKEALTKVNTVEGLTEALQTYESFIKALDARHEAGYKHDIKLNKFIVFGQWYLDSCGNCMGRVDDRMDEGSQSESKPPAVVMTHDDYWKWRKEAGLTEFIRFGGSNLPPTRIVCPVCGQAWGFKTMTNVCLVNDRESVSLIPYIGMTVAQIKERFLLRSDGVWLINEHGLRNDKYIDLSMKYSEPEHEWQKGVVVNERGWIKPADDHVIEAGDKGSFVVLRFYHKECHYIEIACETQRRLESLFKDAGYTAVFLRAVPNDYGSEKWRGPWFNALTPWGVLSVGWRKSVIAITNQRGFEGLNMDKLFEKEEVTKGVNLVHAWSYDKAREYLREIRMAVS